MGKGWGKVGVRLGQGWGKVGLCWGEVGEMLG